jgi:hypothetical protein
VYGLRRLLKNSASAPQSPSAAEAGTENKSVIAAVNAAPPKIKIEFFSNLFGKEPTSQKPVFGTSQLHPTLRIPSKLSPAPENSRSHLFYA